MREFVSTPRRRTPQKPCSAGSSLELFAAHHQRRDEIDRQRSKDGAGADHEQDRIVAAGSREQIRQTVSRGCLEQREYGGGLRPGGALTGWIVRNEFVNAAEHQRNDAGGKAADG